MTSRRFPGYQDVLYHSHRGWTHYRNPNFKGDRYINAQNRQKPRCNWKLHISIQSEQLALVEAAIREKLLNAANQGLIPSFKIVDLEITREAKSASWMREKQLPIVIFLHNQFDPARVGPLNTLLNEIEDILVRHNINCGDMRYATEADIFLPGHFTFRQTVFLSNLNENYIAAHDPRAGLLRREALQSDYYRTIQQGLSARPYLLRAPSQVDTKQAHHGEKKNLDSTIAINSRPLHHEEKKKSAPIRLSSTPMNFVCRFNTRATENTLLKNEPSRSLFSCLQMRRR